MSGYSGIMVTHKGILFEINILTLFHNLGVLSVFIVINSADHHVTCSTVTHIVYI